MVASIATSPMLEHHREQDRPTLRPKPHPAARSIPSVVMTIANLRHEQTFPEPLTITRTLTDLAAKVDRRIRSRVPS